MSLFGALNTASSGIAGQSAAFTNISDNIANSQSTGYKRVDTSFADLLTSSNAVANVSGAVSATPDYVNTIEGTVTQTDNPLGLAIKGDGFFSVSRPGSGVAGGAQTFSPTPAYTRDGNFQLNQQGYLVNDTGDFLNGWPVNSGVVNRNSLAPIQVSQAAFKPVPTTTATLAANLPPGGGGLSSITTQASVYDALGQAHQLNLTFTPPAAGTSPAVWALVVNDDSTPPVQIGGANITFNADGTPAEVKDTFGGGPDTTSGASSITLKTNYSALPGGGATQNISFSLGTIGLTDGLTQDAAAQYSQKSVVQNGIPPGTYSSTTFDTAGDVMVNYSNGQSLTVARVPISTFAAPDQLQRQDGQSFIATALSGQPQPHDAGTQGAGGLATSSLESSNVDIGSEFTTLIQTQQAYTANTKVITTASTLLQATINMVQ